MLLKRPITRTTVGVLLTTIALSGASCGHGRPAWTRLFQPNTVAYAAGDGTGASGASPESVLVIGGSESGGWGDHGLGGYILRAFATASSSTTYSFLVNNHSIPGANCIQLDTLYRGRYDQWLTSIHPNIVVIAWGLLNDAHPHTPLASFSTYIQSEIQRGLDQQAVVFVVTPPVSKASYDEYPILQQKYVDAELKVAQSFHSPNVYVFNVFDHMKQYLAVHHQTYVPYMADVWHPNSAGHQLAATLLSEAISSEFTQNPIEFRK